MIILHVTEVGPGGTISVIKHLINHQISKSPKNKVICIAPNASIQPLTEIENLEIISYKKISRGPISILKLFLKTIYAIIKYKPHILHLHSTFSGLIRLIIFPISKLTKTKVIYCPHGYSFLMRCSKLRKKLYVFLEKLLSISSQKIICVSNFEAESAISAGINKEKIVVIYNGVENLLTVDTFSKTTSPKESINYLFLGRNDPAKGFDTLLKAIDLLPSEYKIKILVAGIESNEFPLNNNLDKVQFLGWLSECEVKKVLIQSDVLVLPSRWEGFPMAALEAMSAGLAVLGSNCTSIPEAVKNGVNGVIFPVDDHYALAKAMKETKLSQWQRMGFIGRSLFEKNFKASQMCEKTYDLYISVTGQK